MKKCKHKECKRKEDKNDNGLGYCNQCIQLPTLKCNYCLEEEKKMVNKEVEKNDLNELKIDKSEWEKTITTNRKKMLQVFLAGATVATLVWWLVFFIYIKTGFRL
jgi:hypothetical protein